jgi:iron complex outermembrane receptor protein
LRYTKFKHGDDYFYEYFHRVDLSKGTYTALSDRLLATECNCNYSEYYDGFYADWGVAGLTDIKFDFGLGLLLGARYDKIHVKSISGQFKTGAASDTDGDTSWTASVNYETPVGIIPYVTFSRQGTVIAGQGAEIATANVAGGTWLSDTDMKEAGIKGQFLDKRLFAAIAVYEQKRIDYNAQSITVNQAVETKGFEAELRWAVTDKLLVTAGYTNTKVVNLTALNTGVNFSFFGIEDMKGVNPALFLGGQPGGLLPIKTEDQARRAGIPENLYSLTATYKFDNGLAFSGSLVNVDETFSGQSQAVKLPAYTLVDVSGSYELKNSWLFRVTVKNATDEEYYRANFTELFGSTIVLPEKPRSYEVSLVYKF